MTRNKKFLVDQLLSLRNKSDDEELRSELFKLQVIDILVAIREERKNKIVVPPEPTEEVQQGEEDEDEEAPSFMGRILS